MRGDETDAPDVTEPPASRGRRIAFRVCLLLFALFWLTIGFGIIDFASGFAPGDVLSAAYGVIAGIVIPVGFLAQLRRPGRKVAALQQVGVVAVAFGLAGALALDPLSFISVGTLTVMLAVLLGLHPARPRLLARPPGLSIPVAALPAVAAAPWIVYALRMAANERGDVPPLGTLVGRMQGDGRGPPPWQSSSFSSPSSRLRGRRGGGSRRGAPRRRRPPSASSRS